METNPHNDSEINLLRQQVQDLQQRLHDAEHRAERNREEWSAQYDQHRELREAHQKMQHDYESLRLQKGGFGFKMLLLIGAIGTMIGLVFCFLYIKLRPQEPHAQALQRFRREQVYQYEIQLSNGQFEEVHQAIHLEREKTENQSIHAELDLLENIVGAARRGCK